MWLVGFEDRHQLVAQQHVEDDGKVSRTSAKGKWHVLAASIEKQAESHKRLKQHLRENNCLLDRHQPLLIVFSHESYQFRNVIDAALAFLMAIAKDAQFERQRPVLLPLIRLVEPSTYIDPDSEQKLCFFDDFSILPLQWTLDQNAQVHTVISNLGF